MAVYLHNVLPTKVIHNNNPTTVLYHRTPSYDHIRTFGCLCYPNLSATAPHKLAPRSTRCVFFDFPSNHRGYQCLDLSTGRVHISHHVTFDKSVFLFITAESVSPSVYRSPDPNTSLSPSAMIDQFHNPYPAIRTLTHEPLIHYTRRVRAPIATVSTDEQPTIAGGSLATPVAPISGGMQPVISLQPFSSSAAPSSPLPPIHSSTEPSSQLSHVHSP